MSNFKDEKQKIVESFGSEEAFYAHFGGMKFIGVDKYGISVWV